MHKHVYSLSGVKHIETMILKHYTMTQCGSRLPEPTYDVPTKVRLCKKCT